MKHSKLLTVFLFIIIPLFLLYLCTKKRSCEQYENWKDNRFFHKGDYNPFLKKQPMVASAPCHSCASNASNSVPTQSMNIENFDNQGNNKWRDKRFFNNGEYNPYSKSNQMIPTAPCHSNKNIIEGFLGMGNLFGSNKSDENNIKIPQAKADISSDFSKNNQNINMKMSSKNNMNIGSKMNNYEDNINNDLSEIINKSIPDGGVKAQPILMQKQQKSFPNQQVKLDSSQNILKNIDCKFYHKCPDGYNSLGTIGLDGDNSSMSLNCNGVVNSRQAKAVAVIMNGGVESIVIIDEGHGYPPDKEPQITINGSGVGCKAKPIIDDMGAY